MQVSWIDSDQLKGLLDRLGDSVPQAKPGTQTWETHTMPEALVDAEQEPAEKAKENPNVVEANEGVEEEAVPSWEAAATLADQDPDPGPGPGLNSSPKSEVGVEEDDVGEKTSPDAVAPEVARIRDRLREVRERAEAAGLLKRPVAAVSRSVPLPVSQPVTLPTVVMAAETETHRGVATRRPPLVANEQEAVDEAERQTSGAYFEVPVGTLVERLEAFAQWAHQQVLPGELVLLDEHGDVLWGTQAKGALILSAMMAANALSRSSAAGACQAEARVIRQALSGGGELAVLSCTTQAGLIHLAVEHPVRLGDAAMRLMGQALISAISVGA